MNHEVERFEGELRELRAELERLRARAARCTCGAMADPPAAPAPGAQEPPLDLFQRLGCLDCDS